MNTVTRYTAEALGFYEDSPRAQAAAFFASELIHTARRDGALNGQHFDAEKGASYIGELVAEYYPEVGATDTVCRENIYLALIGTLAAEIEAAKADTEAIASGEAGELVEGSAGWGIIREPVGLGARYWLTLGRGVHGPYATIDEARDELAAEGRAVDAPVFLGPDSEDPTVDLPTYEGHYGVTARKVNPGAAVADKALAGLTGTGSRWELERTLEAEERDRKSRKAARDVAKQDHRADVEVVAVPDVKTTWKSLEGWDGLAVDQDAHEAEPCHRLVVGYHHPWDTEPSEVFYCAEPGRHEDDGDSDVKVFTTDREAEAEAEARRAAAAEERQKTEERRQRLWADAVTIAGGLTDRNTALKVLARFMLGAFADEDGQLDPILRALDIDVPEAPDTNTWEDPDGWKAYAEQLAETVDGLTVANLYRAAVLYVLTMTTHSTHRGLLYGETLAGTVADLLEIELTE